MVIFKKFFRKVRSVFLTSTECMIVGHFLLTELLLPKLRKSQGARIVIHSSKLHLNADTADPDVVDSKKHWGRISSYNRSKLANVSFLFIITIYFFLLSLDLIETHNQKLR
jgi:NAD(P)-dependent dehydrogenase (short-subunit alcohol dehydrogenase family)